jgi:hypothetical protein
MKRLLLAALLCSAATLSFAQTTTTTTVTTVTTDSTATTHKKTLRVSMGDFRKHRDMDSVRTAKTGGFTFGITFSRFDIGLSTLVDNGSFTLSPKNDFLSYRSWKTSNVGFDLVQFGYRFTNHFKVYLSGGFDWTLIRLRKDITIQRDAPVLTYTTDNIDYSKNRFSSTYLRVPLSFEFRTREYDNGKRFRFIIGPDAGLLLGARVKQISEQNGKQKFDDDYHFTRMEYGAFTRIGYGSAGIFAKYYVNDMFENSPAQAGLKKFAFGFTFGF